MAWTILNFQDIHDNYFASVYTHTLDSANDAVSGIFIADADRTIDNVYATFSGLTGSVNVDCTIETVTASTGYPSGTALTGGATQTETGADGLITFEFGSCDVSAGDVFAVRINAPSADGSNNIACVYGSRPIIDRANTFVGRLTTDGGTTWTPESSGRSITAITVEYTDGTVAYGAIPRTENGTQNTYDSGQTYPTYSVSFRAPYDTYLRGFYGWMAFQNTSSDFRMFIHEGRLGTDLTTADYTGAGLSIDFDASKMIQIFGAVNTTLLPFSYPLRANVWYTLSLEATTTNDVYIYENRYPTAALRKAYCGDCFAGRIQSDGTCDARGEVYTGQFGIVLDEYNAPSGNTIQRGILNG